MITSSMEHLAYVV